jgi:hypothetical protein
MSTALQCAHGFAGMLFKSPLSNSRRVLASSARSGSNVSRPRQPVQAAGDCPGATCTQQFEAIKEDHPRYHHHPFIPYHFISLCIIISFCMASSLCASWLLLPDVHHPSLLTSSLRAYCLSASCLLAVTTRRVLRDPPNQAPSSGLALRRKRGGQSAGLGP